jgi:hypothetical protein
MRHLLACSLLLAGCAPEHLPDVVVTEIRIPRWKVLFASFVGGIVDGEADLDLFTEDGEVIEESIELHGALVGLSFGLSAGFSGQGRIILDEPRNAMDLEGSWVGLGFDVTGIVGVHAGALWRRGMRLQYANVSVGVAAAAPEFEWMVLGAER